jgi:hypothetical protein
MDGLILEGTSATCGAVFEVYQEMCSGFLEPVYKECLEKESNRSLSCFRACPSVRWLRNSFPLEMPTASQAVVCLVGFARDLAEPRSR